MNKHKCLAGSSCAKFYSAPRSTEAKKLLHLVVVKASFSFHNKLENRGAFHFRTCSLPRAFGFCPITLSLGVHVSSFILRPVLPARYQTKLLKVYENKTRCFYFTDQRWVFYSWKTLLSFKIMRGIKFIEVFAFVTGDMVKVSEAKWSEGTFWKIPAVLCFQDKFNLIEYSQWEHDNCIFFSNSWIFGKFEKFFNLEL